MNAAHRIRLRGRQAVALTVLAALLSVWSFAPARAVEHRDRIDTAPYCSTATLDTLQQLEDAPFRLLSARLVSATEDLPTHCKAEGEVSSHVGVRVYLPVSTWNHKLISVGNGGWGGAFNERACQSHLKRGYACVTTDTGHKSHSDEGLWAQDNLPAQIDFAYRATHVAALTGKAIVAAFYGVRAQRAYFMSCSTGGYQGLVEAQRFPWDFHGIIAGAPDMDEADLNTRMIWADRALHDDTGAAIFDQVALNVLHQAVLRQCDRNDGLEDGLISDPLSCSVNLNALLCHSAREHACLNPAQLQAAQRLYQGPPHSAGRTVRGTLPGSELMWPQIESTRKSADAFLKYMLYGASQPWSNQTYDFDHDYTRLGLSLYLDTNPDLRHFQASGHKLLVYQGGHDVWELPEAIVDYYSMVERLIGSRQSTQAFFRLFIVPGMNHCTGGEGPFAIDYLSYLEAWVEHQKPPNHLVGAHVNEQYLASRPLPGELATSLPPDATSTLKAALAAGLLQYPLATTVPVDFSRPIYPYPLYARYTAGNPHLASSFEAASDSARAQGAHAH